MNEDTIEALTEAVSEILDEWNPLGDNASAFLEDDEGYMYEAGDILAAIAISGLSVREAVSKVLSQAFDITLDEAQLTYYADKIKSLLKQH